MYKFENNIKIKFILEKFENMIINKKLKSGDKIIISELFIDIIDVDFKSIEKALKIMELLGLVEIKDNEPYIAERFYPDLCNPISLAFILDGGNSHQIFESRIIIECQSAALAAERRTQEELEVLEIIVERMKIHKTAYSDKDFHFIISKMTQNKLLYYQTISMVHLTDTYISTVLNDFIKEYSFEVVYQIHYDVFDAIKRQDSIGAFNAMKKHFDLLESIYD